MNPHQYIELEKSILILPEDARNVVQCQTMSKKHISKQQAARINTKQRRYQERADASHTQTKSDGLVITRFARHAIVESTEHQRTHCSIRPDLDSLVAGDQVVWQTEGLRQGVVISRYPRKTVLGRPDKQGVLKPIAANITQLLIVIAPKPTVSWALLDSYLIIADYFHFETCIILNKVDLPCTEIQQRLAEEYQPLGYRLLFTGADDEGSTRALKTTLNQQTSIMVGQSGVGKSSLVARLLPQEQTIQTKTLSARTHLGQHTTSNASLYHVPSGGHLIDSPGVREFGLWHLPIADIAKGFREFKPYLSHCKFRNCHHIDTIGCALIAAVTTQKINQHRYDNYVRLVAQFAKPT